MLKFGAVHTYTYTYILTYKAFGYHRISISLGAISSCPVAVNPSELILSAHKMKEKKT